MAGIGDQEAIGVLGVGGLAEVGGGDAEVVGVGAASLLSYRSRPRRGP